jgi:hypothetical protein
MRAAAAHRKRTTAPKWQMGKTISTIRAATAATATTLEQLPAETKTVAMDPLPLRQVCARVTKGQPRNPHWVRHQLIRHHRRLHRLLHRRLQIGDRLEATVGVVGSSNLWPLLPHSRWANRDRSPFSQRLNLNTNSRDISNSLDITTLSRPFSRRLSIVV